MSASFKGHEGVVRLLLARGARQELQGSSGFTALHVAVKHDHAGTVALLCAAPAAAAALALRSKTDRTPLAMAVTHGRAACEAVLRAHGALV
jgi:ankyrin repeat protein